MVGRIGIQLGAILGHCLVFEGGGALNHSGIALEGGNHIVQLAVVVLAAGSGIHELGIQLDVVHAHPAAVDMAPVEAVDNHPLADGDTAAQSGHAHQSIGGARSAADIHAGGAVHNGTAHAVAGAAAGGSGGGDIVQVNPALVNQAPCHAVHNLFPQDNHGGAGGQGGELGIAGTRSGADIQADGAADHGGAAGGDIAAGLGILLQGDIAHGNPALVNMAPGCAVHIGLFVHGDGSALVQPGGQRVAHAGSGTDIHLGSAGHGAGSAAGEGRIGDGAVALLIGGVGQENPALGAVAPLAAAVRHGDGHLLAPLQGAHLGRLCVGTLADVHIVVGDGDGGGGDGNRHLAGVVVQHDPAAGGQLNPLLQADYLLGHNGNGDVPGDFVHLGRTGHGLVQNLQDGLLIQAPGCVNNVGGQAVVGGHRLGIAALLPAGRQNLTGGGGADTGHQCGAAVPAQELVTGPDRVGYGDGIVGNGAEHLNLILVAGDTVVAHVEQGIAQVAAAACAVGSVEEQVGNGQAAGQNGIGGGVVGKAGHVEGADGIGHGRGGALRLAHLGNKVVGPVGAAVAVGIGHPDCGIPLLLHQLHGAKLSVHLSDAFIQLIPQELICIGLVDGLPLGAGGAVANLPLAAHLIGTLVEAHGFLNYPDAGLADRSRCRSRCGGDGCGGDQADQQHDGKHQASKSLFHRNLLLYTEL